MGLFEDSLAFTTVTLFPGPQPRVTDPLLLYITYAYRPSKLNAPASALAEECAVDGLSHIERA